MNKKTAWLLAIIFLGTLDISIAEDFATEICTPVEAGISSRCLKGIAKFWKSIKGCSRTPPRPKIPIKPRPILVRPNALHATEILSSGISEMQSSTEILPKIDEYLAHTKPRAGSVKIIRCQKIDADNVRVSLYEEGKSLLLEDKILKLAVKEIKALEYDIYAMQENHVVGQDGLEYVEFIIPRKPAYVLDDKYHGRIFECMVFNIPQDVNGNWQKFKEFLFRFFNDLLNRPGKLWDEAMFMRGLREIDIDPRDVREMEQYMFAESKDNKSKDDKSNSNEILKRA